MVMRKTSGLFMLAIRLMQLFSGCNNNFTKLITILGLYFQIRDDYCNLTNTEYADSKSFCDDLTEGKFSFPIVYAVHAKKYAREVLNILKQSTKSIEVKKYCVHLLEKAQSFEYTRNMLKKLNEEARTEAAILGPNEFMDELLDQLYTF